MVERSFHDHRPVWNYQQRGLSPSRLTIPDRINYMLENAGVKALLVQNKTTNRVKFEGVIINLEDLQITRVQQRTQSSSTNRRIHLCHLHVWVNGSPKVMIEHRSAVNRLSWMQKTYPIDKSDVILQKTPYYFDVSVWELFCGHFTERNSLLPPGGEGLSYPGTVKKHHVSVMHFVPSIPTFFGVFRGQRIRVVEG
jgi:non-ribosomal peptide synthetase component F